MAIEKLSVALTPELAADLRDAVLTGEYASTSEVIRDALRGWKLRRQRAAAELGHLRNLVREGIESGPSIPADVVFDRLEAKYASMLEAEDH